MTYRQGYERGDPERGLADRLDELEREIARLAEQVRRCLIALGLL